MKREHAVASILVLIMVGGIAWLLGVWTPPFVELAKDTADATTSPELDRGGPSGVLSTEAPSQMEGSRGSARAKTPPAQPAPRIALRSLFDDPRLPWSAYPRTERDFPPWVMRESSTIRAGLLFRHIQLNARDLRLTVPARELLDLTVRNHLQVLSRLQELWTDSLRKELAEVLAKGTAWQVKPSAPLTRDQQEQVAKRIGTRLPESASPYRPVPVYSIPSESMVPGGIIQGSLDGVSPATWSHLESMPVSAELHNAMQQASFSMGKAILDYFSSKTLLTQPGHRALLQKMQDLLHFIVR